MLSRRQKIWIASLLAGSWASFWIWELWLSQQYGEICNSNPDTHQKYCATYNVVLVFLWHITEFLNYYAATIAAIATVFIAGFTATLWRATTRQAQLTRDSINLARREFVVTHRPKLILREAYSLISDPLESKIVVCYTIANIGGSGCWMTKCHLGIDLVKFVNYPGFLELAPDLSFASDVPYIGEILPGENKRTRICRSCPCVGPRA